MNAEAHPTQVDILAIGAHPDDVELCCGGTIARLVQLGYRVGLVEMTRGELGTRGTVEQRSIEASTAASILGVHERENLGIPDGDIQLVSENRLLLVELIRKRRPKLIITHSKVGHPDHWQTHELVNQAIYHAGLAKLEPDLPRHRTKTIAYWIQYHQKQIPDVVVDISEAIDIKEKAIRAYGSQLHNPNSTDPDTVLTHRDFLDRVRAHNRFMGNLANCPFGEGFLLSRSVRVGDLAAC
jgi:bacillithiol biosynthesis deacetylase BshB1